MLGRRGRILAVCSKNDHANAIEAFALHPEMILRLNDIACFVANRDDKVADLCCIADQLNIGIDFIVFVDAVPSNGTSCAEELPLSERQSYEKICPGTVARLQMLDISRRLYNTTRYFCAVAKCSCANVEREALKVGATDLEGDLASLEMKLEYKPFDKTNLQRIVQLINKYKPIQSYHEAVYASK